MNQTEAPPTAGLVADKYALVRMIGRGGMGSVWEAKHASLGTTVAIKFIEAEYADSVEARKRFDNEAKAAATIQSKHAIQIYDHGVTPEGKPYIVMELLQGEPLDKRIERMGRLSLQDTARILQQVCRGLSRAHERGIVHRDLKPENIFLVRNQDDDEEVAKVLDFGIAKLSNSPHNPGVTSSTKTGAVLGTPFYMSPEQARGLRNVDHRTDVWSIGVIAFKCVTGKLPFDGESVGDLLVKICTAPIPMPSQAIAGLPSSFDAWFQRALEREPDRRFSSVTEAADALGAAAGMAPRSQVASSHGQNLGQMATAAVGAAMHQGVSTPQGLGPAMMTPAPQPTPFGGHGGSQGYGQQPAQQGYGTGGGQYQARSATPNPAGMTNAPFTSSQPVPGVGGGKGKIIGGLVGVLVVAAGIAAFVKFGMKPKDDGLSTDGARLTPPASASVATPVPPPSATPPEPANTQGAGTIAVNAAPPPSAQPTQKAATNTTKTKPTPVKPPTTPSATATATATQTAAPLPTPTSTAKKPPKNPNDPGY